MLEIIGTNATEPAVCLHPETVSRDGGVVCFHCGKRMERQHEICVYRITDKPPVCEICGKPYESKKPLTVADVLKKCVGSEIVSDSGDVLLDWTAQSGWRVWTERGGCVLRTQDESAACAEFLRLTGGES